MSRPASPAWQAVLKTCPLLFLAALAWSCSGDDAGQRYANILPHVKITGAPKENLRTHFQVHVFWAGWDDDGQIVRFEYAVDPPPEFTPEEVASPETAPGLELIRIRGPRAHTDTLRVAKTVEGGKVSYDWVETPEADRVFELETPAADSTHVGGNRRPLNTFSGVHTVYVRSRDNLGAYSVPDRIGFTNFTVTPTAWIVKPNIRVTDVVFAGGKLHVTWGGSDPDPPTGVPGVVGYYYKLIPLEEAVRPYNVFTPLHIQQLIYVDTPDVPWVYVDAKTTNESFFLTNGEQYVFVIRAVDALGAVEPFVETQRLGMPGNVMKIVSGSKSGSPILTLNEPNLGNYKFTGTEPTVIEVEVAVDTELNFSWSASAETYGGVIEGFSWGLDVPDLDKEGPGSRWQPWSKWTRTLTPIVFRDTGVHVFYLRVRDEFGTITTGAIILKVFDLPLTREVLLIDDYKETRFPLDHQADAFWDQMFEDSGRFSEVELNPGEYKFDVGGVGDALYLQHFIPKLSHLGKYKMVVWNVHGNGICAQTGLLHAAAVTPIIRPYLNAGGKLWVVGPMSLASMRVGYCGTPGTFTPPPDLVAGDVGYPLAFAPGEFGWDYLKVFSQQIMNDANDHWRNAMLGVLPYDPENPIYPQLDADPSKFHAAFWAVNAITASDALFAPGVPDSGFTGVIDSLYTYVAAGPVRKPGRELSQYDGKVCATRWHDPDPARKHGRTMWWGFPLYYMKTAQAQEAFNGVIDWFKEETAGF